jgi:hypothetical protein
MKTVVKGKIVDAPPERHTQWLAQSAKYKRNIMVTKTALFYGAEIITSVYYGPDVFTENQKTDMVSKGYSIEYH